MTVGKKKAKMGRALAALIKGDGSCSELDSLLGSVSDAISIHSLAGDIVWVNTGLCDIASQTADEIKGRSCQDVFHPLGDRCEHAEFAVSGRTQLHEMTVFVGKPYAVTTVALSDDEKPIGFARVLRNASGLQREARSSPEAERFAILGQLLFAVVHKVGTPLNIISGYAEYLLMRKTSDDQGEKALAAIIEQSKRVSGILNEALALFRPTTRGGERIDLKTLLTELLDLVGHCLSKADTVAKLTCGTADPLIYGEASQLRLALFSVLIDAARRAGSNRQIEVLLEHAGGTGNFVSVTVRGAGEQPAPDLSDRREPSASCESIPVMADHNGLSVASEILSKAGGRIEFGDAGSNGFPIIVYLLIKPSVATLNAKIA